MWRWDQGRLLYFQFDVLKATAKCLVKYDGARLDECESLFRQELSASTGMPFAPDHYTVIRNYKRMFECAFLATKIDDRLVVSDFAKELAKENGSFNTVDDYLLSYISRFRFPFPAFNGYDIIRPRVYPFCAIIKFLIAKYQIGKEPHISIDEIFHYIIANECTGNEEINYYTKLVPKAHLIINDTKKRQLREMIIFISQLSILKVYNGFLWLDISNDASIDELLKRFLIPHNNPPKKIEAEEFIMLTSISTGIVLPTIEIFTSDFADAEFIEGNRKRVEHFRVDRSRLLRKYYMEQNNLPICNMCNMVVSEKYPWTDYMLDIHHLLPLSSSIAITTKGTSLDDIVGLCPSCHRSIHIYYSKWLKKVGQDDFGSKNEAMQVYLAAIKEIA